MDRPLDIPHLYTPEDVATFVSNRLRAAANEEKASQMARYMKTTMPFYGVQKPGREQIARAVKWHFRPETFREYERLVLLLWKKEYREEKYLAVQLASTFRLFITMQSMDLYERMIREGAWWDFVDDIAIRLVGQVVRYERTAAFTALDTWIRDENPWIRRAVILSQVMHREQTDHVRLFEYCRICMHETDDFIRKAIGWALRDYSQCDPGRVLAFVTAHQEHMSGLSVREATRLMGQTGLDVQQHA